MIGAATTGDPFGLAADNPPSPIGGCTPTTGGRMGTTAGIGFGLGGAATLTTGASVIAHSSLASTTWIG
ncbi:MAG: hypothetical protein IJT14_03060 [Rickettsiales bacterium]|nr:hypothetical protein [Rickettsiales bacterium]